MERGDTPNTRAARVARDVPCGRVLQCLLGIAILELVANYYAWYFGAPGIPVAIASVLGVVVLGCLNVRFEKFGAATQYFFLGLPFGFGKFCLDWFVYWMLLVSETDHMYAMVNADFAVLFHANTQPIRQFGAHHDFIQDAIKTLHYFAWFPLACNFVWQQVEASYLFDALFSSWFVTDNTDGALLSLPAFLQKPVAIFLKLFGGVWQPFVVGVYFACYYRNGIVEAQLNSVIVLPEVKELFARSRQLRLLVGGTYGCLSAVSVIFERRLKQAQLSCFVEFFTEFAVKKDKESTPVKKAEFIERVKAAAVTINPPVLSADVIGEQARAFHNTVIHSNGPQAGGTAAKTTSIWDMP